MNHKIIRLLDLFSGIGGFSLGLEQAGGFETVAFCEIGEFQRGVLANCWPEVPCYDDIRMLTADALARDGIAVDAITGGFPCQDVAICGRAAGLEGAKSGLWNEMFRLISDLRPRLVVIENSPVLRSRGLEQMLRQFCEIGYDAEWHCIPLNAVDAPHRRDRVWIIAYPSGERDGLPPLEISAGWDQLVYGNWWHSEPAICRVVDAVSAEPHRLAALGNAVSPVIPELIGRAWLSAIGEAA
ncbi:DNA cytosine methyltransferase [Cereibacter changlensis]|uniref:DNA cytosine methyltransferase n=1 Tax=Cereibacter changlensis TaxID=402884 RepID=UPI0040337FAF